MSTDNQSKQALSDQLEALIKEAEKINRGIEEDGSQATKEVDALVADIQETIGRIKQTCADIDNSEQEANDNIDRSILEEAEFMDNNE